MTGNLVILFAILLSVQACSLAAAGNPLDTVDFVTIEKGVSSAYTGDDGKETSKVQIVVLKTSDQFAGFWSKHQSNRRPLPSAPQIDFAKDMVIAVLDAPHNTGGYALEVKEVRETPGQLIVEAVKSSPGRSCMVTQAFTRPYHIIKIAQADKPVVLSLEELINDCR